jgi:hypothetical protein
MANDVLGQAMATRQQLQDQEKMLWQSNEKLMQIEGE